MDINGIMKNKITKKSTIRDVMQVLGTDLLRQGFNNNIHVAATIGSIKENEKVIITDLRFPNEMKAVEQRNGITIRVNRNRPGIIPSESDFHPSETSLDNAKFSYTIENNGTLDDLIRAVKQILIIEKVI